MERILKLRTEEEQIRLFSIFIIEEAHRRGINIRQFKAACDSAVMFCREAPVPTTQDSQTLSENQTSRE